MARYEVKTQKELNKALKKAGPLDIVACVGSGYFEVSGFSRVTATDSSQVTAYGSSQVTATDSSQVTAYGSSQVRAPDSSQVRASKFVAVTRHAKTVKVSGGVLIDVPTITTAKEWCDYYGVPVMRGIAVLFKAVDDDYSTDQARVRGISYRPGAKPAAPDWDPEPECGGGLHFVPRPIDGLRFFPDAKRFVACPVKLSEIVVHRDPRYPNKVKAPRVYGECYEVDIDGGPVARVPLPQANDADEAT